MSRKNKLVTENQDWNVTGMVVCVGHLLVVHMMDKNIYIYSPSGQLTSRPNPSVTGLICPRHLMLMTDETGSILVISDWECKLLWLSVSVRGGQVRLKSIRTTQLAYGPVGMCVTSSGHLMVCGPRDNRLYRYNSQGEADGHIQLSPDIKPGHVISFNDMYIIGDYDNKQVVWVKLDGSLLHTVQGRVGQSAVVPQPIQERVGQLCEPMDVTWDRYGRVLVADCESHQVMMFDQHAQYTGQLLYEQDGIYKPTSLWLDEQKDKLYIACMKPTRVMIYDYSPLLYSLHETNKGHDL